ncbi:polymer-forming cytoskeletal protein [Candidatus Sumerlaeota bacterium]|nr:polymer-forming cytoskeletal protein [Candidatus Sumerlaeota bacterium]
MALFGKRHRNTEEPESKPEETKRTAMPASQTTAPLSQSPPKTETKPEPVAADLKVTPTKGTGTRTMDTQPRNSTVGTVIGEDTNIDGKVHSKGTLRIDGTIKGEVNADDKVIVGQTGEVFASIEAKIVTISGKVHGNIIATERVELQPTCEILGDVQTAAGALIIESGAKLEGNCTMGIKGGGSGSRPAQSSMSSSSSKPAEPAGAKSGS